LLALKTMSARPGHGRGAGAGQRTLIFDEVDAGIGGRVAEVVGARLQALGSRFQVLCITHLPQIAARGTTQFRIEKTVRGARTVTSVERLDAGARVNEIARMIGGAAVTDAVRATAAEMLGGSEMSVRPDATHVGRPGPARESSADPAGRKRKSSGVN
jgi:DNA repair ATPase RecN